MCDRCLIRQGRLPWGLLCLTVRVVGILFDRRRCANARGSDWVLAFPFHGEVMLSLRDASPVSLRREPLGEPGIPLCNLCFPIQSGAVIP